MKNNTEENKNPRNNYIFPKYTEELAASLSSGKLTIVGITGSSLESIGIYPGDGIAIHRTNKIQEDQLTMWDVFDIDDHYITGFAYENFGDISIMRPDKMIIRRRKKDVKLLGVVVGILRDANPPSQYDVDSRQAEISVICCDCGKTETGSEKFLKAQGWCLKNKPRCVKCDLF